jgi:CBS domain-containing protein
MHTVHQILTQKGRDIWAVRSDDSVLDAVRRMAELKVGAMMVMADAQLEGMISERDYARKVILEGRSSRDTPVRDIMSAPPITINSRATADEALALMTRKRIRHLPVVDDGEVIGLVSIGDLVNAKIEDQQRLIEQLEHYVSG